MYHSNTRAKLGEDPIRKAETFHHINSVFGILLIVLVFLCSMTINLMEGYPGERIEEVVIVSTFLVVLPILTGLVGMLRESIGLMWCAWTFGFICLLVEVLLLGMAALWRLANIVVALWQVGIFFASAAIISFVLALYPVIDAYYYRLSVVSCKDRMLTMFLLERERVLLLAILAIGSLTLLLMILVYAT